MTDKCDGLMSLLRRLEEAKIYFTLLRVREDTLMVMAHVPGERCEIEYTEDGTFEVEVFRSDGAVRGEEALTDILLPFMWLMELGSIDSRSHFVGAADETTSMDIQRETHHRFAGPQGRDLRRRTV